MADNQMVKIQFDFDLGNVPASAKKFAQYLKGIEGGSKEAQDQLKQLGNEIDKTSDKMNKSGDSIKKSNQQWTNFALVIQDLPYGFRGIQNNLPALMGGIAGMAGPLYLVGSAIIALFTAWDQGSFTAKNAIDRVAEAHKKMTEGLTKGADAQSAALVELSKMSVIFNGVKDGTISAKDALEQYNTTYGETWGIAKSVNEAEDSFIKKSNAYVQAMALRAMANEKYAQAQEAFRKGELARGEDQTSFLQKFAAGLDALDQVGIMGFDVASLNKWAKAFSKNYADTQKVLVNDITNESASSFEMLMSQGRELEKRANKKLSDVGIKQTKGKDKGKTPEQLAKEQIAKEKAANDAQTKAYIDTLDERGKKEYQAGLELADNLTKMKAAGFTDSTTYYSAYRANMDKIAKEYDDKEYKRNQDSINANIAAETKFYDDSNRIFDANKKKEADQQRKFADQRIKNIEAQLGVELKLHKSSIDKQKEDIQKAMAQLAVLAATSFSPEAIKQFLDAFDQLGFKLAALPDRAKEFADQFNSILSDTLIGGFTEIGTQLGNIIAGVSFNGNGILMILADAIISIGKALIMYSALVKAAKKAIESGQVEFAIPLGIAAIAAGVALKNLVKPKEPKAFANGGIVSGPTMGLIGEYPGAKSNPEVVAPLDKLKDMLGNQGGGQFILRGTDLVLALNRSETSLNLRRGS